MIYAVIAIAILFIIALLTASKWSPMVAQYMDDHGQQLLLLAAVATVLGLLRQIFLDAYEAMSRPRWARIAIMILILFGAWVVLHAIAGRDIAILALFLLLTTSGIVWSLQRILGQRLSISFQAVAMGILIGCSIGWMFVVAVFARVLVEELANPTPTPVFQVTQEPDTPAATPVPTSTPTPAANVCEGVPHSSLLKHPDATHQVMRDENLSLLAMIYGTTVESLKEANREIHPEVYSHPNCLRVGIWLIIPTR